MERQHIASAPMIDREALQAVHRRREQLGSDFPRVGLFLFDCPDLESLQATLDRIPEQVNDWLADVVVMSDRAGEPLVHLDRVAGGRRRATRIHRSPRDYGHGGARKAAFEYALRNHLDHAITMRGDGTHPPEALPALLRPVILEGRPLILASRLVRRRDTYRAGMPLARLAAHWLATELLNRLLGLRVYDYHSSYRIYAVDALASLPFQLDSDDRRFDTEITVQFRALGVTPTEVAVLPAWREERGRGAEMSLFWGACGAALGYRMHQLHVTRRGRYLVNRGVHYTLKLSETGSHMQIVLAIRPGARVLDLGCSQGLLARPLREKGVLVTGVDANAPRGLAAELHEYVQRDLELPLELPTARVFDYVVCADVIEHVRQREELLRSARRYLKEDGRLIISTPNIALWFYRLSLFAGRFEYGPRGILDRTHVHLFTRATFRREVEKAGFHVLRERVTALPFEVVFESTGRSRLLSVLASLYHAAARAWPEMFAYQFILEAEITTLDDDATKAPSRGAFEPDTSRR
jgi:2-polyprenyl-3-methyl-5-hydroxy-6-metoxy-1,4-benzoquinol methylase